MDNKQTYTMKQNMHHFNAIWLLLEFKPGSNKSYTVRRFGVISWKRFCMVCSRNVAHSAFVVFLV